MANDERKGISWADLVAIVLLAMIGGVFVGGLLGAWLGEQEICSIAAKVREKDPKDPLDGLGFLRLGYIIMYGIRGWLIGTAIGAVLVLDLLLKASRRANQD